MYIYVCLYIYTSVYIYIIISFEMSSEVQTYLLFTIDMCVCMHVCLCVCMFVCLCMRINAYLFGRCQNMLLHVNSSHAWLDAPCEVHTATHCNTLQHTATHCNTLQHTARAYLLDISTCKHMCILWRAPGT